jgi:hypothetical protein
MFLALCSTAANLKDLEFSVGVVSLSWFVPVIASGTRLLPLNDLAVRRRFQGPWRGHAYKGLGRSKWHFSGFNGTDGCNISEYRNPHVMHYLEISIGTDGSGIGTHEQQTLRSRLSYVPTTGLFVKYSWSQQVPQY